MIRIAITGTESTGKSTLAQQLASHYQTLYVREYSREYLEPLSRHWVFEDIEKIATGQVKKEDELSSKANQILFADTELIVIKIWYEYYGWRCPDWIIEQIKSNPYDLYLFMNKDLPWQADPLRENPNDNMNLFPRFEKELKSFQTNYRLISGVGEERFKNAVTAVEELLAFSKK